MREAMFFGFNTIVTAVYWFFEVFLTILCKYLIENLIFSR
jgi:hypothetical protein